MNDNELKAIAHELNFWKGFVKTKRFINGWVSRRKTPELNQVVYDFLQENNIKSVLDVGSGACSILNGSVKILTATDPLGELYECIFDYESHNIKPPKPISGESLIEAFNENEFDVCHISNALDHCQDPNQVLNNLIHLAKKYVIVQGFVNEADYENHEGFHQWNIDLYCDELTINGRKVIVDGEVMCAEKVIFENNKEWIIWILKIS